MRISDWSSDVCSSDLAYDFTNDTPGCRPKPSDTELKMKTIRFLKRHSALAAVTGSVLLAGCAAVQTTGSGTVGVNRTQYMSSMVSEQALVQESQQQYNSIVSKARAQGALDTNAKQTARVKAIAQKLIAQVGVFRPDAAQWNWEVHVLNSDEVNAWCMPGGKIAVYSGMIEIGRAHV